MNRSLVTRLASTLAAALPFSALLACSAGAGSGPVGESTGASTASESLAIGECDPVAIPVCVSNGASTTADPASGLAKVQVGDACAVRGLTASTADDGSYQCCKTGPEPVDGGPGAACTASSLGRSSSCADPGTWRDDATKTCEEAGGTLADFSVTDECGDGLYRYAKFSCCSTTVSPPPTPVPPPVTVCISSGVTSPDGVCTSDEDALEYARSQCQDQGLALVSATPYVGTCPAGYVQGGSFECCSGPTDSDGGPAPTPPPISFDGGPGLDAGSPYPNPTPEPTPNEDGGSPAEDAGEACTQAGVANSDGGCSDDAAGKASAEAECEANGQTLTSWQSDQGSCAKGSFSSASYACCADTTTAIDAGPAPSR